MGSVLSGLRKYRLSGEGKLDFTLVEALEDFQVHLRLRAKDVGPLLDIIDENDV